jgi:hypothetical protein
VTRLSFWLAVIFSSPTFFAFSAYDRRISSFLQFLESFNLAQISRNTLFSFVVHSNHMKMPQSQQWIFSYAAK